ncbi:hypothetical protein LOY67_15220 [Pseudomonas sp. B21-056]|jgi:hypothetical protein|uniref:hypothetical protein n=1 Tax=Pseudomonas sp. B21-056 TaxID=2895495 RepID=UPI00222E2536|nr:hypothetical protein [Pseudomonas sp. B21-056]UZE21397.1 hypothetical protein LOY67_15220 [Pseudomonas sp. B21-056]
MLACKKTLVAFSLGCVCVPAMAQPLYNEDGTQVDARLLALAGAFYSRENYSQSGTRREGSSRWQEAALQYGLDARHTLDAGSKLYGSLNWVSSATFGDGDPAGWTAGSERTTKIEDAYAGWRSGTLFDALGENGVDLSFGRQNIVIGDGFLVSGDALNFGKEFVGGKANRGGAYYLSARKAFDRTAVLRLGGQEGLRSDLMWIKSDNPAQSRPEMAVGTLEHVSELGTLGLTYLKVTDTDQTLSELLNARRKGMQIHSVRGQGNAGIPGLFLAGEYAWERKDGARENAWYLEAGWTFADVVGTPSINYRYSRFSEGYDPLFYGNGRALGTWFQGEVAANYAGPFNSNAAIQQVGLKISAAEDIKLGMLLYSFRTLDDSRVRLDADEANVYAEWAIDKHWTLMPLAGLYKPKYSAADGGAQVGNSHTNLYGQVLVAWSF